jgi:hypothetical protein
VNYVGTFQLENRPWLVRVDVGTRTTLAGPVHLTRYTTTESNGSVRASETTLGPDINGVGLPFMAVIDMIRDLRFSGVQGAINLVHAGPCFSQEALDLAVECSVIGDSIQSLATSAALQ